MIAVVMEPVAVVAMQWLAGWLPLVRTAHSDADIDDELQKLYNKRR